MIRFGDKFELLAFLDRAVDGRRAFLHALSTDMVVRSCWGCSLEKQFAM